MTQAMKASILFITYKHEAFVAEAVRSAMAQDYPNLELVVCDDGSPDRTREILERELEDCPSHISIIRCHSEQNQGFHTNFNCGLAACTGDVIVAMSGDDISLPHRVSKICGEFAADSECMLVCSNWLRIDDAGKDLGIRIQNREDGIYSYSITREDIYALSPICGATAAYRASLRDSFPPMMKGKHAEDNCFWFRGLLLGNVHYLNESLVLWRTHTANLSNWVRGQDTPQGRSVHIRFLCLHECMTPQWRRDLSHALATNLITLSEYNQHLRTILITREWSRLLRLSVTRAPWSWWLASASRLLKACAQHRFLRKSLRKIRKQHLPLRSFASRRNEYWRYYFHGKRR